MFFEVDLPRQEGDIKIRKVSQYDATEEYLCAV